MVQNTAGRPSSLALIASVRQVSLLLIQSNNALRQWLTFCQGFTVRVYILCSVEVFFNAGCVVGCFFIYFFYLAEAAFSFFLSLFFFFLQLLLFLLLYFLLYTITINCLGIPYWCVTKCCEQCARWCLAIMKGAGFWNDFSSDFLHQKMK